MVVALLTTCVLKSIFTSRNGASVGFIGQICNKTTTYNNIELPFCLQIRHYNLNFGHWGLLWDKLVLYTSKSNINIKSYLESDGIIMSLARQEKVEVEILGTRLLGNEASVNFAREILLMTSLSSSTFCSLQYVVCSLQSVVCSLQSASAVCSLQSASAVCKCQTPPRSRVRPSTFGLGP